MQQHLQEILEQNFPDYITYFKMDHISQEAHPSGCPICAVDLITASSISNNNDLPTINSKRVKLNKNVWSYLYLQNIQDALSLGMNNKNQLATLKPARLTFAFSSGNNTNNHADYCPPEYVHVCLECSMELDILEKFHTEMETARRKIDYQVNKIQRRRKNQVGSFLNILSNPSKLQMSLASCTIGKNNIAQALTILTTVCNNLPEEISSCPSQSAENPEITGLDSANKDAAVDDEYSMVKVETGELTQHDIVKIEHDDIPFETDTEEPSCIQQEDPLSQPESECPSTCGSQENVVMATENLPSPVDTIPPQKRRNQKYKRVLPNQKPTSVCSICGKVIRQNLLFIHMRVHTGVKPYKCDSCDKSFTQATGLKRHKLLHTGERPYSCEICGYSATQQSNLRAHKRRVHQVGMIEFVNEVNI